jgi:DNA-binding LacI/PurR family transcriptional regulator/signal transduction histidine kinase
MINMNRCFHHSNSCSGSHIHKTIHPKKILNTKRKRITIGLLTDWIEQRYQASVYAGIVDVIKEKEINLLSFVIGSLREPYEYIAQRNVIADLAGPENVDGLILMSGALSNYISQEEINAFIECYRPLPLTSIALPMAGIPSILVDNKKGMRDAIIHLIKVHGYYKIAFIRGPVGHQEAEERYQTYTETLAEYNIPINDNLIVVGDFYWDSGARAIQELIYKRRLKPKVDFEAVVASNDFMAISAMETLEQQNIRIPNEVAVVGFDNIEETTFVIPPLTTVRQPFYEQGKQAAETLLAIMAGEKPQAEVILPTQLVVRNSCGCFSQLVQQVNAGEINPTDKDCKEVSAAHRKEIISNMKQALGISQARLPSGWADQLLDTFIEDVNEQTENTFIVLLDDLLQQYALKDMNINAWHEVISVLHSHTKPCLLRDIKVLSRAERLWQQGRILIGEMLSKIKNHQIFMTVKQYDVLSQVSASLMTTFDILAMMDVIAHELPRLNIKACYIALYEKEKKVPSDYSRLVLAYNENGRVKLKNNELRFSSREIIPEKLLIKNLCYTLAVMPLFYREDHLGFILFEVKREVPKVYEILRHQISSALKGASLLQERRQAEKELALTNKELEAFTYSVAHDLRAPLRGMDGFSQALLEDHSQKLGKKGREYLQRIQNASQRMGQLIDGLLQLSRLARSEIQVKRTDLSSIVKLVIEEFQKMDPDRMVEFVFKENVYANGDIDLLKIMFRHLIDNAWKFTSNRSNAMIEFGLISDKGKEVYFIKDNGIGFDMEYADNLFDAFQRHHTEYEGTGIGLAMVQRIIQRHEGKIWAEGKINRGATFYFTLT